MNELQLLKMYGQLPHVTARELPSVVISDEMRESIAQRTCGCPDVADAEIAETEPKDVDRLAKLLGVDHDECERIIDAHRRMLLNDPEDYNNNRWGKCYPAITPHHALKYFLDLDTFPAHYKRPVTREELERVVEAGVFRWTIEQLLDECLGKPMVEVAYDYMIAESYRVLGCKHIRVFDGPQGNEHNVHIYSTSLPGSVIGRAWFTSGSCTDHVNHQIDKGYKPDLIGMAKLGCHEFGHNHGEPHQFSGQSTHHGVMSYDPPRLFYGFSTGTAPHTLPRDPSLKSLVEKYGGDPVPLDDSPTTPTPTDPTQPPTDDPSTPQGQPNGVVSIDGALFKIWLKRA